MFLDAKGIKVVQRTRISSKFSGSDEGLNNDLLKLSRKRKKQNKNDPLELK
jgi:hypothetical protein